MAMAHFLVRYCLSQSIGTHAYVFVCWRGSNVCVVHDSLCVHKMTFSALCCCCCLSNVQCAAWVFLWQPHRVYIYVYASKWVRKHLIGMNERKNYSSYWIWLNELWLLRFLLLSLSRLYLRPLKWSTLKKTCQWIILHICYWI